MGDARWGMERFAAVTRLLGLGGYTPQTVSPHDARRSDILWPGEAEKKT